MYNKTKNNNIQVLSMDLDKNTCKEAQLTSAMLFDGAEFTEARIVKKGLELLHIQKTAMVPWSQFT